MRFNILLLTFRHTILTRFNRTEYTHAPARSRARRGGINTTLRAKRGRKRGGARNGAERAALNTARSASHAAGGTRLRNIPEREKGHGAGMAAD